MPYLVITGEQAFTRPGAEQMYQNAASEVKDVLIIHGTADFTRTSLARSLNASNGG